MIRLLVAAGFALLAIASPATARPFTAKDLATLDRVSDPRLSPDGHWVAYNIRSTDWDNNRGVNALYLLDRQQPSSPVKLIGDEKTPAAARWSADGRLYFLSGKSGSRHCGAASVTAGSSR